MVRNPEIPKLRLLAVALATMLLALMAACSPTDSGVEGHITAGPNCPVVRVDVPCPDRPFQGTLTVLAADGRTRVAMVSADAAGYYRLNLAPGTYVLHPVSPAILPRAADVTIVVRRHEFTVQDIVYDTGIR